MNELPAPRPITEVRQATPGDARAIAEITVAGWRAAYRGILPDGYLAGLTVGGREAGWRAFLDASDGERSNAWVAVRDATIVGFVSVGPPRDDDAPEGGREVYAIYVDPAIWRTGAGRLLLDRAVTWGRSVSAPVMLLWVLERNERGRAFYEAMGWRPDGGRQELTLGGDSAIEVRYRLELG